MNWILVRDPKIGAEPGSIDVAEDTDTITLGTETFKRVAVGERRFGLYPTLKFGPKNAGCTRTRLSHVGSGYTLRHGQAVQSPDRRTVCTYGTKLAPYLELICVHPGTGTRRGFLFFPSTGNIERY